MSALRNDIDNVMGRAPAASHSLRAGRVVHAAAGQSVPLHLYEGWRISSEIELLEIPNVLFSEDYASLGTFFLLFVQLVPAFCPVTILLLVNRVSMPSGLKAFLARILFHLKTRGWRKSFSPGCWSVSLS